MRTKILPMLAAAVIAPAAFAQSADAALSIDTEQHVAAPRSDLAVAPGTIHSQADDLGHRYGVWAAGDDYKVSFHDGMQFVPYLGRDYPVTQSLRWRTASATVGGVELATRPAEFDYRGLRAEFAFGSIVEAYDVRRDGVEQTFVLRQRPDAVGDLVIRGDLSGNLIAQPRATAHAPVDFADGLGVVHVRYGAAVAVDANGRRRAMTTAVVDGDVELRLDGAWLEHATFPVVVDPLISPVGITSGDVIASVDVAHDASASTRRVWYATSRWAAADDADLRIVRTHEAGTSGVVVFEDLSGTWSTIEPSLGVNVAAQAVLCAFTRHFGNNDTRRIRVHRHDRNDINQNGNVLFYDPIDNLNRWRPDVGHELSAVGPTSLLVACQTESTGAFANTTTSRIDGIMVALGGLGAFVDGFVIADFALTDCERPSIAKCGVGAARTWTVAYQRYLNFTFGGTANWNVELVRVADDGTTSDREAIDGTVNDMHQMAPRLAGLDDSFMLFWTESTIAESSSKPLGENGHRVRGVRIEHTPAGFVKAWSTKLLNSNADARVEICGVDHNRESGSHYALLIRSNVSESLYLRVYGYHGNLVTGMFVDQPSVGLGSSAAGAVAYAATSDEFSIAYGINEPGIDNVVQLARYDFPVMAQWHDGPSGCTAATATWYGSQWIGTEDCGVAMNGAPANSFSVVLLTTGIAQLQLFGVDGVHDGCWLLVPIAGPQFVAVMGPEAGASTMFPLPLPEGLPDGSLHLQGVVFDGNSGEFYSTDRLNVMVGR